MTRTILPPGIHYGISPAVYHADPCETPSLSSSLARELLRKSPAHSFASSPRLDPGFVPEFKDSFDVGTAAHTAVLSAGESIRVMGFGNWRSKEARQQRDEARAEGYTPLLEKEAAEVLEMAAKVKAALKRIGLPEVFSDPSRAEVVAIAEVEGAQCRAMADYVGLDGWLYDLKTTTSAHYDAVTQSIVAFGYHIQHEHYLDTFRAAGMALKGMRFVFVEKNRPHCVSVIALDEAFMDIGRSQTSLARKTWRRCLATGEWPDYAHPGIVEISPPIWMASQVEDRSHTLQALTPRGKTKPSRDAAALSIAIASGGAKT
jgi:hypothetical protein